MAVVMLPESCCDRSTGPGPGTLVSRHRPLPGGRGKGAKT